MVSTSSGRPQVWSRCEWVKKTCRIWRISSSVRSPMPVPASMSVSLSTSREVVRKPTPIPPLQPRILMPISALTLPEKGGSPPPGKLNTSLYMRSFTGLLACAMMVYASRAPRPDTQAMQLIGTAALDLSLYLLAALGLLSRLLARGPLLLREGRGLSLSAALSAVLIHSALLYGLLVTPSGLDLGYFNALALAGWLMALIGLAVFLKPAFENLGLVLFP